MAAPLFEAAPEKQSTAEQCASCAAKPVDAICVKCGWKLCQRCEDYHHVLGCKEGERQLCEQRARKEQKTA